MIVPFNVKIEINSFDYNQSEELFVIIWLKHFIFRKSVIIKESRFMNSQKQLRERKILLGEAEHYLYRWIYTHLFFYEEATRLERFLLWFKKVEHVDGARIKTLFSKTFIYVLL